MAEQRLIDANELRGIESLLNTDIIQGSKEASWLMSQVLHDIAAMPTIDPETLPIVCQLRAELDNLRKEKRPTATLVKSIFGVCCSRCKTECSPQWVACPVCGAEIKTEATNDQS